MSVNKFLDKAKKIRDQHEQAGGKAARHDAPAAGEGAADDESNWLVSYADMMTLLCGFFIMMFSMSHLDEPKYEAVKEAVAKEFRGEYKPPETKELARMLTTIIGEAGIGKDTVVRWDSAGATVEFQSTVFFDSLSADVKSVGHSVLEKLIDGVTARQRAQSKVYKVVVEGHTDAQPIVSHSGAYPTNWELSGARASRVVRMFAERGFPSDHLTSIGYGDTRPEAPSKLPNGQWNEAGLARNRRVVLRILEPKVDAIPFADPAAGAAQPVAAPASASAGAPTPVAGAPTLAAPAVALATSNTPMAVGAVAKIPAAANVAVAIAAAAQPMTAAAPMIPAAAPAVATTNPAAARTAAAAVAPAPAAARATAPVPAGAAPAIASPPPAANPPAPAATPRR